MGAGGIGSVADAIRERWLKMDLRTVIQATRTPGGVGTQDAQSRRMIATPWVARTKDGMWIGADGSVWLYLKLPPYPYAWERAEAQLQKGIRFHQMLEEIGKTSRPPAVGEFASLSKNRRVHLVTHIRYVPPKIPAGATPELRAFLREVLGDTGVVVPELLTAIGIQLWPATPAGKRRRNRRLTEQVLEWAAQYTGGKLPDLALYHNDKDIISGILGRYGATSLDKGERDFLQRWISGQGNSDEPVFVEEDDRLVVRDRNPHAFDRWLQLYEVAGRCDEAGDHSRAEEVIAEAERIIAEGGNVIQFIGVTESGMPEDLGKAPNVPWLMDAQQHERAAICTNVRYELEPGRVTRNRARRLQRFQFNQMEEELEASKAGLNRIEQEQAFAGAKAVEDHFAMTPEPSITKMSLLWAWEVDYKANETFADYLRARYDIDTNVMSQRQYDCLAETLPTSPIMAAPDRPYSHDAFIQTLAYSGIGALTELGDSIEPSKNATDPLPVAAHMGVAHPSGTVMWLNPWAASQSNSAAGMLIAGRSGSGKTHLAEHLCYQFQLCNIPVFFVNPKGSDSLAEYAAFCGGELIRISEATTEPGAFDPFRFGEPEEVPEIASHHIVSSMNNYGSTLTMTQVIAIGEAVAQGVRIALANVERRGGSIADYCSVGMALQLLPPEHAQLKENIYSFARQNKNFALGIGFAPRGELGMKRRFTLVEFDQDASLPERSNPNEISMGDNAAIAGQRLLWQAGIGMIKRAGGGVVGGDEAWTFLSSPNAASIIQGLGRKARSMRIFLMLMTQKVADVINAEFETFLSYRVVLHLDDQREIAKATALLGMENRPDIVDVIRNAKPSPFDPGDPATGKPPVPARPSQMVFRDMSGRVGVGSVEPIVEKYRIAFSTNPLDKERRKRMRGSA